MGSWVDWQRSVPRPCSGHGVASSKGARGLVPDHPAPRQIDPRAFDRLLARHTVPVVLLAQALHSTEVSILQRQLDDVERLVLGMELERPRGSQRKRDDEHVPARGIEQWLIVAVPAYRLKTSIVVVGVARIG